MNLRGNYIKIAPLNPASELKRLGLFICMKHTCRYLTVDLHLAHEPSDNYLIRIVCTLSPLNRTKYKNTVTNKLTTPKHPHPIKAITRRRQTTRANTYSFYSSTPNLWWIYRNYAQFECALFILSFESSLQTPANACHWPLGIALKNGNEAVFTLSVNL